MFKTIEVVDGIHRYVLKVPAEDHIGVIISKSAAPYERDLLRTTLSLLRPGDRIADVGANIGNHTIFWAIKGFDVDAFEPNPAACEIIEWNVAQNMLGQRVLIHQHGLGSRAGPASLAVPDAGNLGGARIVERTTAEIAVEIRRLDDVLIGRSTPIRLIKIDTEGFEEQVLKGAVETLKEKPILIIEEHSRQARRRLGEFLRTFGYVRVPFSLAYSPTFIHLARREDAVRLIGSPSFWKTALTRLVKDVIRSLIAKSGTTR